MKDIGRHYLGLQWNKIPTWPLELFLYIIGILWVLFYFIPQITVSKDIIEYFDIDAVLHIDSALKTYVFSNYGLDVYGLGWYKLIRFVDLILISPIYRLFFSINDPTISLHYSFLAINCISLILMYYVLIYKLLERNTDTNYLAFKSFRIAFLLFLLSSINFFMGRYIFRIYPDILLISILGIFYTLFTPKNIKLKEYIICGALAGLCLAIKVPAFIFITLVFIIYTKRNVKGIVLFILFFFISYVLFSYPDTFEKLNLLYELIFGISSHFNKYRTSISWDWTINYLRQLLAIMAPFSLAVLALLLSFPQTITLKKGDIVRATICFFCISLLYWSKPVIIDWQHYLFQLVPFLITIYLWIFLFAYKSIQQKLRFSFSRVHGRSDNNIIILVAYMIILIGVYQLSFFADPKTHAYVSNVSNCSAELKTIRQIIEKAGKGNKPHIFSTPYVSDFPQTLRNDWWGKKERIPTSKYDVAIISKYYSQNFVRGPEKDSDNPYFKMYYSEETIHYRDITLQKIYDGKFCPVVLYKVLDGKN